MTVYRSHHAECAACVAGTQDTGDTRETPAIDVCKGLVADGAMLRVYDPQVRHRV